MNKKLSGFTIVELLVVIVVIGILAAITIVSYTGISSRAIVSSLQSDLSNAATQLKMYQVEHSAYPSSIGSDYCPTPTDTKYCLKASSGNSFDYANYLVNNSTNPQTYSLNAVNGSMIYVLTNSTAPTAYTPLFYDNFNRANGILGSNWTSVAGTTTISGNKVVATATDDFYINIGPQTDSKLTVTTYDVNNSYVIPMIRTSSSYNSGYGVLYDGTQLRLLKGFGTGWTSLAMGSPYSLVAGGTMGISAVGTTIKGYINGVLQVTATDSTFASGYAGIKIENGSQIDDFKVEVAP